MIKICILKMWLLQKVQSIFRPKAVLPSNILVTAPHGSARVPIRIFRHLTIHYQTSPRLLLNFSDYGTQYLIKNIPDNQKAIPAFGRLVGDPNRSTDSHDLVRFQDFGGNKIFRSKFESRLNSSLFRFFWKQKLLNYSYKPFYREVYKKIEALAKDPKNIDKPIILIDLHDVGNRILGTRSIEDSFRATPVPAVIISNAPGLQTGEDFFGTAPKYFMKSFSELIQSELKLKPTEVKINDPYKGGNMIRNFGNPYQNKKLRKILNDKKIFALQVELNRGMYLNEINQRPNHSQVRQTSQSLIRVLQKLGDFEI
jgi:N-formylglutamate amidohydrolase